VSTFHALALIGVVTLVLYGMWRVLDLIFELIEFWHDSWRADRYRQAQRFADFYVTNYTQPSAEDGGSLKEAREASDSR
jgi:hypothetical protein